MKRYYAENRERLLAKAKARYHARKPRREPRRDRGGA